MKIEYPILVADGKLTSICDSRRGVYCWFNKVNNKRYVGIGAGRNGLKERLTSEVFNKNFGAPILKSAIEKYGIREFIVYLLYEFSDDDSPDFVGMTERIFIKSMNSMVPDGYNLTAGGKGTLGFSIGTQSKHRGTKNQTNSLKRAKTAKFRSPTGDIHNVTNIGAFSVALGFPSNALYPLANRQAESYKGWTLAHDTRDTYAKRLSKTCYFIDPVDGSTVKVRNLNRFCAHVGLNQAQMNRVSLGDSISHKGWIRASLEQISIFVDDRDRFWDHDKWSQPLTPTLNTVTHPISI